MKLQRDTREDSKGFSFYSRFLKVFFHHWIVSRFHYDLKTRTTHNYLIPRIGWCFKIAFGNGAGYRWGSTFYLGWNARGGIPGKPHGPWPKFRIGLTQNGNATPYGFR